VVSICVELIFIDWASSGIDVDIVDAQVLTMVFMLEVNVVFPSRDASHCAHTQLLNGVQSNHTGWR
jgi:hypothetical protein